MKKIAILLILISGIVLLDACKKAETDPKLDFSQSVAPEITEPADGSSFVLTKEEADNTITFKWSAASYSLDNLASTFYLLQMIYTDPGEGGELKDVELISTTETTYSITYAEINNTLLSAGFTPGVAADVTIRVSSSLKSYDDGGVIEASVLTSKTIGLSLTPYGTAGPPEYAKLWVPGDYQGWAPDLAPNVYSVEDDGIYSGYVYYPPESASFLFKFTDQPNWDGTNYGTGATPGTLDPAGDNLEVAGAGNYFLTANLNDLIWTNELLNFALVGTMTEWGTLPDLELTWDADNLIWTITLDLAADAEFKWRANSDWAVNLGINDPDDGLLVQEGANIIPGVAGNYTVNLYLYEAYPRYELIAN
jgi:hypothetical protein